MAHNGGRSQRNMGSPYAREHYHLNHLKSMDGWRFNQAPSLSPSIVNGDGYLSGTPAESLPSFWYLPDTVTEYSGAWIADWQGDGTWQPSSLNGVTVSEGGSYVVGGTTNRLQVSGVNGRVKFTFNSRIGGPNGFCPFSLDDTNTGNLLRNCRIYRADHESRVLAGEIWNPDFLAVQRRANNGWIRFLGWGGTASNGCNNHNVVKWTHRPIRSSIGYWSDQWFSDTWVGSTGGTSTAYTCTKPSGMGANWADRDVIQFKLHTTNGLNPTIKPGSLAAKPLVYVGNTAVPSNDLVTGRLITGIYDADFGAVIVTLGGIMGGVPYEDHCDLLNALGAHGHFIVPHFSNDNYISSLGTLINASLDSALKAKTEYTNEDWNFIFEQTQWSQAKGVALGYTAPEYHGWYARRFVEMMQLLRAVEATRFKGVIGVQTVGNADQYEAARLLAPSGASAPNRAIDYCYSIEAAGYMSGPVICENDANYVTPLDTLFTHADNYVNGTSPQRQAALDYVDNDVRQGTQGGSEGVLTLKALQQGTTNPSATAYWTRWNSLAAKYGVRFSEYEGAYSAKAPTAATLTALGYTDTATKSANIVALVAGYKNDQRAKQFTLDHYNGVVQLSNGETPSQFIFIGAPWDAIPDDIYGTPYKVFDAIVEFNAQSAGLFRGASTSTELHRARIAWPWEDLKDEVEPLTARRVKPAARKAAAAKVERPRTQFATVLGGHEELEEADELAAHGVYAAALAEAELEERPAQLNARRGLPSKSLLAAFLGRFG